MSKKTDQKISRFNSQMNTPLHKRQRVKNCLDNLKNKNENKKTKNNGKSNPYPRREKSKHKLQNLNEITHLINPITKLIKPITIKIPRTKLTKAVKEDGKHCHIFKKRFIEGKRELIIIATYNLIPVFGIGINNPLIRRDKSRSKRTTRRRANTIDIVRNRLRPEIITIIVDSSKTVSYTRIRCACKSILESRTSIIELIIFTRIGLITRPIEIIFHPFTLRCSSILNS